MVNQFTEINTGHMKPPQVGEDLFVNRASFAAMQQQNAPAEVSVIVVAYNHLEKTRLCVESILENTAGVDYELILIDNGSQDGTLEYFQSVRWEQKRVIRITNNLGAAYPTSSLNPNELGRFICTLPNDVILTPHWLENLLICMKSDAKIGMVNPVSSNTSNLQCVNLAYNSYEEMQRKAAGFNSSDPRKWEDRLRIVTLAPMYRKEVLLAAGWPLNDMGFFHDFADDDVTFRIRRLGYRTVVAGDTWICHNHDIWNGEGKNPTEFQHSLEVGKANFQKKYFGIDAWTDANNYLMPYLDYFPTPDIEKPAYVLGVDVRCGAPILDIKNWLRKAGVFQTELSAFTQDPKYWLDLKTICQGSVLCDREDFLSDAFLPDYFDYVIADRPINRYHEPQKMLNDIFLLCKKDGIVACKLKNTFSFQEYVNLLDQREVYDQEFAYNIPLEAFQTAVEKWGTIKRILTISFNLTEEQKQLLRTLVPEGLPKNHRENIINRMLVNEFLIVVKKR